MGGISTGIGTVGDGTEAADGVFNLPSSFAERTHCGEVCQIEVSLAPLLFRRLPPPTPQNEQVDR